jgi:hypothetical protein
VFGDLNKAFFHHLRKQKGGGWKRRRKAYISGNGLKHSHIHFLKICTNNTVSMCYREPLSLKPWWAKIQDCTLERHINLLNAPSLYFILCFINKYFLWLIAINLHNLQVLPLIHLSIFRYWQTPHGSPMYSHIKILFYTLMFKLNSFTVLI